jgi:hypothetical protein
MMCIVCIIAIKEDWELLGAVSGLIFFFLSVFFVINTCMVIGAKNSAQFYNNIYKTSYTAEDVYWNDTFIKQNLIGDKKNINVNLKNEIKKEI